MPHEFVSARKLSLLDWRKVPELAEEFAQHKSQKHDIHQILSSWRRERDSNLESGPPYPFENSREFIRLGTRGSPVATCVGCSALPPRSSVRLPPWSSNSGRACLLWRTWSAWTARARHVDIPAPTSCRRRRDHIITAEAIAHGVHSADVVLNILARQRDPGPPATILTPAALTLRHAPIADCARYDNLRRTI